MDRLFFTLSRDHPHRPPDWRWQLANHLADHPHRPAQADADVWLVQAAHLVRELRDAPADPATSPTAVRRAYAIYAAEDPMSHYVLEARLLVGETFDETARQCGVARDVVAAYSEIFFHVRDRLEASGYIAHQVIGPKLHVGLTEGDHAVLLKIAAYRGLGAAVGDLVRHFRSPPLTSADFTVRDPVIVHDLRHRLWLKMWVLSQTLPFSEAAALAAGVLTEVEKRLALPAEGEEVTVQALSVGLRHANWAIDELRECLAQAQPRQ